MSDEEVVLNEVITIEVEELFFVTVNAVNDPPEIISTPSSTNIEIGTLFSYQVIAQDVDNLALSYGVHESKRNTTGIEIEAQSIQVSYTVGGASVKIAENSADNVNYVSASNTEGRTIALTLAF